MREITNDIFNGLLCNECGQLIDFKEPGYPRTCKDCRRESDRKSVNEKIAMEYYKNYMVKK